MDTKVKAREKIDVGASKAAKLMLGILDRRLVQPAVFLVRTSGWLLVISIAYISIFATPSEIEPLDLVVWMCIYVAYLLLLEVLRRTQTEMYESWLFRSFRVLFNLIMVSALISFASRARYLLILAYAMPLFAAIVYFAEKNSIKIGTFLLAIIGMYIGGVVFAKGSPIAPTHFMIYCLVLAILTLGLELARRRTNLVSGRLTELAKEFYKTLNLQELMAAILANATEITAAQRGLIIIINPHTKRYVGHELYNFKLIKDRSIEVLARKCFVLVHGKPFESPDIVSAFNNNDIYHEFFDSQPRSVMAEPLYNRAGQTIGVINVAYNNPRGFDKISRNILREFAFLVSNAIENCLEHREVVLREARSREAGEKFGSAGSEDEAINILMEEARRQMPHAEKITIHQFLPNTGDLLPIHSYSLEKTPNIYLWTGQKPKKLKPDLRLGYGVAGHALELKDTILVHDVDVHPWFVPLEHAPDIKSLVVAPLFGIHGNELYGTISLESSKPSAFNLEDESTLTYLSTQASSSISKAREFQAWRGQGSALRQILKQIQAFDLTITEDEILQQITDAATKLLGFKIARIRILDDRGLLLTKAVSGVSEATRKKLREVDLPYVELKSFMSETSRAESSYLMKHGDPDWDRFVKKYFHISQRKMHDFQGWHAYDALITPLLDSSDNTLGILTLDLPNTGSMPGPQLLESIGVFASSSGWMIELSRFQKRLIEQRQMAQSFINTISHELAKCTDLPAICEVVVQVGAKLLSAEGCSLYLVHENENVLELAHSNYLADTDYIKRHKPISKQPKSGLTAWVAATGQVLCLNRGEHQAHEAWAEETEQLRFLPSKRCMSVLLAPVKDAKDKVMGVISLENKIALTGSEDFDKEDIEHLKGLADEFARAVQAIGLYDDIKEWERAGLAEDIHDLINWHHSGIVSWVEALEEWLRRSDYQKVRELSTQLRQHALTFVQELKMVHTNFLAKSLEAPTFKQALEETLLAWTKHVAPKYDKEKMRISFNCPENLEIPIKIRNTIIRFASLAFSNAIQHSGIFENPDIEVWVNVEQKDRMITLIVADTGCGIDDKKNPPGFGLDRMRQLAEKINHWGDLQTKFQIQTEVNKGTQVILVLSPRNATAATPEQQGVIDEQ